jgi:outer membrane protein
MFDVHRSDKAGSFRSPRDGFSFGILDYGRFRAGPTTKVKLARNEGDDPVLRGLGDVPWAFEAGAFVEYWVVDWLRTRAELRQGFNGHHGLAAEVTADLVVPVAPKLTFSGGPRLSLASSAATSPYFSITAAQSAASGLPVYDARGGLRSYGAGAQARYEWSRVWATHLFVEYERLTGYAANSPLVTQRGSRDQIQVGMGVTYSFDTKALW